MSIWGFCVKKPVFTTVLTITILLFGSIGYLRMGVDLYPSFEPPVVNVMTVYQGANPTVIDSDVTEVLEDELGALEGLDYIQSTSYEGRSVVTLSFLQSKNIDIAAQEVKDKVSLAERGLPNNTEKPIVQKIDPSAQPVLWIGVTGDRSYEELSDVVENQIKLAVQATSGVGGIQYGGFQERRIRVWLKLDQMRALDLTPVEVSQALSLWLTDLPGGRIENETQELTIKIEPTFNNLEKLRKLEVKRTSGSSIRLEQIANVVMGLEDKRGFAQYDRVETIGLGIQKQSGGNTVEVIDNVKQTLKKLETQLPSWVEINIAFDSSTFIKQAVAGVEEDLILGALATCIVIGIFLADIRTTIISLFAIPTSLVGTFAILSYFGMTVNQMTLLGMSLAVGLVIDDAIVVIESIFRSLGTTDDPKEAAIKGTDEVGFSVFAATTSIVVIFLPIIFMTGIVGQIFGAFALTVATAIVISMIISWTLTPMLSAHFLSAKHEEKKFRWQEWLDSLYRSTLSLAVKNRWTQVLTLAIVSGIMFLSFLLASRLGTEFIPDSDDGRFMVIFEAPVGTSVQEMERKVDLASEILFSYKGIHGAFMGVGLMSGSNSGLFFVTLKPQSERTIGQSQIMKELGEKLSAIPDFKAFPASTDPLRSGGNFGARSSDITYILRGPELLTLSRLSDQIVERLKEDSDFIAPDHNLKLTRPQLTVNILPDQAESLGLTTASINQTLLTAMAGLDVADLKMEGAQIPVRVKAEDKERRSPQDIYKLLVKNNQGELIDLSNTLDIFYDVGPDAIYRYNQQRSVSIQVDVSDQTTAGEATKKFLALSDEVLGSLENSSAYSIEASGQSKVMMESFIFLFQAMALAAIIVFLVLSAQFESFVHPFTVLLSIPLSFVGVFLALFITGKTLNIYSFIGMMMLIGIVNRNAILLIDRIRQSVEEDGMEQKEAVIHACPIRLRPILMTTISAIAGLVPLSLGLTAGGEARAPMGIAVIGGLISSTVLTLLVIPVVYLLIDGIQRRFPWRKSS